MNNGVYINKVSKFLPNDPIANDELEDYLGKIDGVSSKAKRIVLRNNGIKSRYYALNKQGKLSHSNAQLAANAVKALFDDEFAPADLQLLSCGTSLINQMLPSHTAMVHGELKGGPLEIISPSGACCSGMHAMKYGFLSILSGSTDNAICAGSELISPMLHAKHFEPEADNLKALNEKPIIAFEKEFLRWMLSDGAGAALLENEPRAAGSLKIEWMENCSYANELDTCMYAASDKEDDGGLRSWKDFDSKDWLAQSVFSMKQDVKLLGENIVPYGAKLLKKIAKKHDFDVRGVNYFLPHLSSEFFRNKVHDELKNLDMEIGKEKWFTNLSRVGNVGSASVFLMLEELFNSGKLKSGEKILLMVPESARFSYVYALLTVI